MTRDDIIRMAQEAGFPCDEDWVAYGLEGFERFAALVAAAEREACAKVCETFYNHEAKDCAEAIRERTMAFDSGALTSDPGPLRQRGTK